MSPSRTQCWLIAGAGCFPFCNPHRFAPIAGYWGQWAATSLFAAWLLHRWWIREPRLDQTAAVPRAAFAFFALAGLTMMQAAAGIALFRSAAAMATFELLLAGFICIEAARTRANGERDRLLGCFAWGTLAALGFNGLSIVGARLGLQVDAPFSHLLAYAYGGREVGLVGQSNQLGVLAVLACAGATYLWARRQLTVIPYLVVVVIAALLCAASASRTAVGVALLLGLQTFILRPKSNSTRSAATAVQDRRIILVAASLFLAIQVAWSLWLQSALDPATSVLRSSVSGRWEMLRDALLLGWQHPLLGVGFGNYAGERLFALDGSLPNPNALNAHNLFAHVWAEWGVLGLAIVGGAVLCLVATVWGMRDPRRRSWDRLFALAWVVALLAHSMVENPLWSAHFLFPFAWMLGMIPQLERSVRREHARASRLVVASVTTLVSLLCLLAAFDYRRNEKLATRVLEEVRSSSDGTARIPKSEAMAIADATLYPTSAALMQARALDLDPLLAEIKLEMATQSLRALPHAETMARYIAFMVFNRRQSEADSFLQMVRRRNPGVAKETERMLVEASSASPLIVAFLDATAEPTVLNQAPLSEARR